MAATEQPPDFQACALPEQSDRWNPSSRVVVDLPLSDSGATPLAGTAVIDAEVFAFDRVAGEILAIANDGTIIRRIGRAGRGPGELTPPGSSSKLSLTRLSREWLLAAGDTLLLLDGNQLHRFHAEGTHLGSSGVGDSLLRPLSRFPRETTRLRRRGDRIWLDVASLYYLPGASAASASRLYTIWSVASDDPRRERSIPLRFPPITERGAVMLSVLEARPTYDLLGACVVVTDGGSPFVLVFSPGSVEPDTVYIRATLAEPVPSENESATRQASGAGNDPLPPPSMPRRIQRMIVDPDGWVWLLPVQPSDLQERVQVIRLHIASGSQRVDTTAFFPEVFLADGRLLSIELDSLGVPIRRSSASQ